ncbi:hypothetical protein L218DRAFT_984924 [Marasmius fiardii PR-910]|nr:hypothetical protein L218DRAFT_984924 [Marasmius fiardii PR-910]
MSKPIGPQSVHRVTEHIRRSGSRVEADNWKPSEASLDVWIYFNLVSNTVLLPILVVTFTFCKHARRRRPAPLINMCIAWILSGIFSLLLFYDGTAEPNAPLPSFALCTTQLSLLYGVLPMWSVAVLALTYYVHFQVERTTPRRKMIPMPLLIVAPYVVQIAFSIAGVISATTKNSNVHIRRRFFYCQLVGHPLSNAMSIFVFVICLGIILLKIQLGLVFYRNWKALRNARRRMSVPHQTQGNVPVLRMMVFGVYVFAGMICNVISLFHPRNVIPYMYVAIAGTMVFLVFGTQSDILEAWSFWNWRWRSLLRPSGKSPSPPPPTPNPLLNVENNLGSPPNWRDLSLISAMPREEKSDIEDGTVVDVPERIAPSEPPTPLPRVQIVRHIHTNQEVGGARVRYHGETHFEAAHTTCWF